MATTTVSSRNRDISRIGVGSIKVTRLALALALTSSLVFGLCWLGAFIPLSSPTHAYIGLFTLADTTSLQALVEGGGWSFLFGGLVGAMFALIYNALSGIDPR